VRRQVQDSLNISNRSVDNDRLIGDFSVNSETRHEPAVEPNDLGRFFVRVARRQPDGTWLWMIDQPSILG